MLITDGLAEFKIGYRKAMYAKAMPRTVHMADVGILDRHPANNVYERFNGEIRGRIIRIRGFKPWNPALLGLLVTYHNFMRPHWGLGRRIPAESAGMNPARHPVGCEDYRRRDPAGQGGKRQLHGTRT